MNDAIFLMSIIHGTKHFFFMSTAVKGQVKILGSIFSEAFVLFTP